MTKDPVREALWLSCRLVKQMVKASFADAIANGTMSWDVMLAGCLGLALQAALASRVGDVKRSGGYTGNEHLRWEHIEMVAQGSTVEDPKLKMLVTLMYRKGHK